MRIGVAKEIKTDEYRVALTPAGARELVQRGHDVLDRDAAPATGSSFPDADYERAGAQIVSVDDVWGESELLLKVKEPIAEEYPRLREGLVLFTYLHIAADEPLTRALVDSGITAVAYETVETDDRRLPLLAPMSEIAGRLAAQAGAYFLEKPLGGRGLLLGGVPGVAPGRVLVLGGGIVGYNAAIIAIGLGAHVTILDRSIDRMRYLDEILSGRVSMRHVVDAADRVVDRRRGRRHRRRARPWRARAEARDARHARRHEEGRGDRRRRDRPGRLRRDRRTRRRTAIPSTRSTASRTTASRTCPAACRSPRRRRSRTRRFRTSRRSPTTGSREAVARDPSLARGVNVLDGKITYEAVAEAHDLEYTPLEDVLPLAPV